MAKVKFGGRIYIESAEGGDVLTLAEKAEEQEVRGLEGGHGEVRFGLWVGREDVLPDQGAEGFDGDAEDAGGFGLGIVAPRRAWHGRGHDW